MDIIFLSLQKMIAYIIWDVHGTIAQSLRKITEVRDIFKET